MKETEAHSSNWESSLERFKLRRLLAQDGSWGRSVNIFGQICCSKTKVQRAFHALTTEYGREESHQCVKT